MDVTGNNVKLWKNEHAKQDGSKWFDYSVGVSKKKQDGSYVNTYMKVKFGRDIFVPDELPNGTQVDFEGYLTVDHYTGREGEVKKPMIMITSAKFHDLPDTKRDGYDADGFSEAMDDIPF